MDQSEVGNEKVERGQVGECAPAHVEEDAVHQVAREMVDREELDFDGRAVAIAVPHGGEAAADGGVDAEFLIEFARQGGFGGFAMFNLAAGKLPFGAHGLVRPSLADENLARLGRTAQDERGNHVAHRPVADRAGSLL